MYAPQLAAAELLIPQDSRTLRFAALLPHGGRAEMALISKDGATGYIVENDAKAGRADVTLVRLPAAVSSEPIKLEHLVSAAALDPMKSGRLFLAGEAGANRALTIMEPGGATASYVTFGGNGAISLAPDGKGGVYASDASLGTVFKLGPDDFLSFDKALAAFNERKSETGLFRVPGIGGISSMAVSKDGAILFVSDAARPQIVAVSLEKPGAVLGRLGDEFSNPGELAPFSFVLTSRPSTRVKSGEVSSLYLVEPRQRRLLLVDFNESVSTFDGIADALLDTSPTNLEAPQAASDKSSILIGADDAQSMILVGSRNQRRLDLYSRSGSTLQQLVTVGLPDRPETVSLAGDGRRALARLANGRVALLDADPEFGDGTGVPISGGNDPVPIGEDLIREIQYTLDRLGFRVGAIDGMVGGRTKAAIRDAIAKFDLDPVLSLDQPETLLEALKPQVDRLKSAN